MEGVWFRDRKCRKVFGGVRRLDHLLQFRCSREGRAKRLNREKIALICIRNEGVNEKSREVVEGRWSWVEEEESNKEMVGQARVIVASSQ